MDSNNAVSAVLITGAAGNLGRKLIASLVEADWCRRVVAVDRDEAALAALYGSVGKVERCTVDLASPDWPVAAFEGVDGIVHFAVANALPDSTWAEAAQSFDMTARLLMIARDRRMQRFVFASSNHTVGSYAVAAPDGALAAGGLDTDRFAPGSPWLTENGPIVGHAYGAGKIFGERMCLAAAEYGGLSTVAIRIGWCQPGDNHPKTLNAGGNPFLPPPSDAEPVDEAELRWFRNMWLSTRDFQNVVQRAIRSDASGWPAPGIVVNGMSANSGMAWDIETTKRLIGYQPRDNVWDYL